MQQNVVTYATVIDAPNPELKLKPGMTATVTIELARRQNVMRIPNAALRFRPTPDMFAALQQPVPPELQLGARAGAGSASPPSGPGAATGAGPQATGARQDGFGGGGRPDGPGGGFGPPGGLGGQGGPDPERRRQMMERVQSMSPEEREQFFARMREERGGGQGGPRRGPDAQRRRLNTQSSPTVPAVERGANTIDALFAPIEVTRNERTRLDHARGTPVERQRQTGRHRRHGERAPPRARSRARPPPTPAVNPRVELLRQQLETIEGRNGARGAPSPTPGGACTSRSRGRRPRRPRRRHPHSTPAHSS